MADLFNQQISATYSGLLKTSSSGVLSASLSQISDGRGNTSPLYLSTDSIQFYGAYSFPNADGSANQVLKTDGAGVLTWENDSLSNTLDFSGGTGTGSVTLDSQVLAFTGTANEIVTSASSQAITLSFPTAGVTLPDGSIATTQTASDNSTKVATTAYVEAAVAAGGDVTKTGTITANQIAVWNDSTDELRSDETVTIGTDHSITLYQPNTNSITTNYIIGGGSSMTTGQQNTGFGSSVLTLNTTGVGNVAIGSDSLTTNVSGNNNVAIGLETLKRTTASDNIAIGSRVLQFDTTGYKNTAIGGLSQSNITTAYENTSLGYNSLIFNSTGIQNTAIGLNSLKGVSTYSASNNTAIGYNSGSAITTGSNNVIIGSNTGSTITTSFNNIIISDGSGNIRQSFDSNGDATFSGSVAISEIATITQTDAGTEDRGLRLTNTTGSRNWNITAGRFNQNNDDFTIRCADTNIDALYLSATGDATFTNGINAPTLIASGSAVFNGVNRGTDYQYADMTNTSGRMVIGVESSVANYAFGGSTAYSTNFGSATATDVCFITTNQNRLTISSGGNVGINNTIPSSFFGNASQLVIGDGSTSRGMTIYSNTNTDGQIFFADGITGADQYRGIVRYEHSSDALVLFTNATEKMRISSGGDLSTNDGTFTMHDVGGSPLAFKGKESNGGSEIDWYAFNGTTRIGYLEIAQGAASKLNVETANDFEIYTDSTKRLTITSDGFTKAKANGGSYFNGSYHEFVNNNNTSGARCMVIGNRTGAATNNTSSISFTVADNVADRLVIYGNGNVQNVNNAYGQLSDLKLKENISEGTPKLNDLLKVKVKNFNFIGSDIKQIGVIAQELEEIFPSMIDESPDTEDREVTDEEGNVTTEIVDLGTVTKSVKYSVFTPMLIKAIQEQQTIIEDLKARIEKLEG